jgi:hypothetical protein
MKMTTTHSNSIGWDAKKAALEESMELIHERIEEAKQNVANNTVSPIIYFMELNKWIYRFLQPMSECGNGA